MRKYYTAFAIVALLAVVITAVCLISFEPVESLMKPPMSDGENHEIQLAFEEAVEKKYKMRVPISGDYRAAFIFNDFNGDLQDEVVVFYSTDDALDIVRMNYMAKINQQWISVADVESAYSEIHQVEFSDLDSDGIEEILVGWAIYQNDLSRNLSVYKLPLNNNGELEKIYSVQYSDFQSLDIDGDSVDDIAVFENVDAAPSYMQLSFDSFDGEQIVRRATINLDSSVYSVMNFSYDASELYGFTRMFVDGYKIDSGVVTECIYFSEELGTLEKLSSDGKISVLSTRMTNIGCEDVNSDGLIDIPIEITLENSKVISDKNSDAQPQSVIRWLNVDGKEYHVVANQMIYANNEFRIMLSEDWLDALTIENNYPEGAIYFYLTDSMNDVPLFELKYVTAQAEEDSLSLNYKLLKRTDKGKLFYKVNYTDRKILINRVTLDRIIIV